MRAPAALGLLDLVKGERQAQGWGGQHLLDAEHIAGVVGCLTDTVPPVRSAARQILQYSLCHDPGSLDMAVQVGLKGGMAKGASRAQLRQCGCVDSDSVDNVDVWMCGCAVLAQVSGGPDMPSLSCHQAEVSEVYQAR